MASEQAPNGHVSTQEVIAVARVYWVHRVKKKGENTTIIQNAQIKQGEVGVEAAMKCKRQMNFRAHLISWLQRHYQVLIPYYRGNVLLAGVSPVFVAADWYQVARTGAVAVPVDSNREFRRRLQSRQRGCSGAQRLYAHRTSETIDEHNQRGIWGWSAFPSKWFQKPPLQQIVEVVDPGSFIDA